MGVTYKAVDVDLHPPVTLKVIKERYLGDESARLRFLREARAAASVRHANVASVFHLGRTGQNYFCAMEFVEGETLEDLIKRSGDLLPVIGPGSRRYFLSLLEQHRQKSGYLRTWKSRSTVPVCSEPLLASRFPW
jgi:serine/threonine protein kinase